MEPEPKTDLSKLKVEFPRYVHFEEIEGKVYPSCKGDNIYILGIECKVDEFNTLYVGVNRKCYLHRNDIRFTDFAKAVWTRIINNIK